MNSALSCITRSYWNFLLSCWMVYVQTGGTEEVDNETICSETEMKNKNCMCFYLTSIRSYCFGVVLLSSMHLVSKAVLKGYAFKLLEAAITFKKEVLFDVYFLHTAPKFELKKTIMDTVFNIYIFYISLVWFSLRLLQTELIFQRLSCRNVWCVLVKLQKNHLDSLSNIIRRHRGLSRI